MINLTRTPFSKSLIGLLLFTQWVGPASAQRKPAEPVSLIYDSQLEGIDAISQEAYVYAGKSEGGLYIPTLVLKPDGSGSFPTVILVHGSPGGRTMSDLKKATLNQGMVSDRFLEEGYIVVRCSYRRSLPDQNEPSGKDVAAVIRFVKELPEVDPNKVFIYGGSRGAENSVIALGEVSVTAAVLNAPGGYTYMRTRYFRTRLGEKPDPIDKITDELTPDKYDRALGISFLEKINTPTLFVVGSEDPGHVPHVNTSVALLRELGKESSVDYYYGEKHGFYWGGSIQEDGTYNSTPGFVQALDKAVEFFESKIK